VKKLTARGGTMERSHGGPLSGAASDGQAIERTWWARKPVYL
jgi:hypothetical protein